MEQFLRLHENNVAPQSFWVPSSHSRPSGACTEGCDDLDDNGKFVPAVTVNEEHDLRGVGRLIAGDEGSNLNLDTGVQHTHNLGDE